MNRSAWWFLLPLFLGIIGGIIAYAIVRKDDPDMAKYLIYVGIASLLITVAGTAFGLLSGITGFTEGVGTMADTVIEESFEESIATVDEVTKSMEP